jgi:hypothetical protein
MLIHNTFDYTVRPDIMLLKKVAKRLFSAGIVLFLTYSAVPATEDYSTWLYHQQIVLNTSSTGANVTSTVYGFPVLVRLNPSNFTGFNATLAQGADIRFAKSNGTPLAYDIERWMDGSNDNDTAEIWVRVDTILGNNSTQYIMMYWGNADATSKSSATAVFVPGNGFLATYHLGGNLNDASGNGHNGYNDNSVDTAAGIIGRARAFNGSSQFFQTGDLQDRPAGTISFWFRPKATFGSTSTTQGIYGKYTDNSINATLSLYGTDFSNGSGSPGGIVAKIEQSDSSYYNTTTATSWIAGTWYHICWTWSNGTSYLIVNGEMQKAAPQNKAISGTASDEIGRSYYDSDANVSGGVKYFNGTLDEFRIDNTLRLVAWAKLSYENQKANQSLVMLNIDNEDYHGWRYNQRLYLNTSMSGANVAGTVRKFPVLIRLNPGSFKRFSQTQTGGVDIRFAKADGTHLPYEIERWVDGAGNNDTAEIWVCLDTIYGNSTTQYIAMYWGKTGVTSMSDPSMVFDKSNGFVGVWHLHNDPGGGNGAIRDATSNANNGTATGSMNSSNLAAAVVGKGFEFDGNDDGGTVPYATSLDITNAITISAWIKPDAGNGYRRICSKSHTSDNDPWSMYSLNFDDASHIRGELNVSGNQYVQGSSEVSSGAFSYIVYTFDNTTMRLFLNGAADGSVTDRSGAIATNTQPFTIGKTGYNSNYFDGIIDELRLENVARSADWIRLCHENQKANQSLVLVADTVDNENYTAWSKVQNLYLNTTQSGANVPGNVTNFPVLIRLNPAVFKHFSETQPGGVDIRFANISGVHLPYEIERWVDGPADNDTAEIWVRIDAILGNNATQYIKMYWGKTDVESRANPAKVFDTSNSFMAAYHLGGSLFDATANGITGSDFGTVDTGTGIIGRARAFNGTAQYFHAGDLADRPSGAISFWFRPKVTFNSSSTTQGIYGKKTDDNTDATLSLRGTDFSQGLGPAGCIQTKIETNGANFYNNSSTTSWTAGTWYHVCWTWKNGVDSIYVNGEPQTGTANNTPLTGSANDEIGRSWYEATNVANGGPRYFNGTLDEFRFDKTFRSANWIRLCYENQKDTQSLVSFTEIDNENYNTWGISKKIYLNTSSSGANVAGKVISYPVLVRLNPAVFTDFSNTLQGGADIRFAKSNGTHLPYEIERWVDGTNNNDTAEIWVKVDTVIGNNSTQHIVMFWNKNGVSSRSNGNAVFDVDNAFQGVWHLNELPIKDNTTIMDRTRYANHGIPRNNWTSDDRVDGIIGKSLNFDGPTASNGDYVQLPFSQSMDNTGDMTISCWFRLANSASTDLYGIAGKFRDSASIYSGYLIRRAADQHVQFMVGDGTANAGLIVGSNKTVVDSFWHHAAGVVNAGVMHLYLDGNKQNDSITGTPVASVYGTIGRRTLSANNSFFIGDIDEVRFNNTARSADWIKLSFENQRMGQKLVSFSPVVDNYSSWNGKQKIYINTTAFGANITGTVTNFPLLVRLNPVTFKGFAETSPGGADIRFSNANNIPLQYAIERWANDTAEIWVKVDTIRGNNAPQYIQMHWAKTGVEDASNSSEVFDNTNGFVAAYHLNETSGSARDATSNGLNAEPRGALPDGKEGVVGYGNYFNGAASYYTAGNDPKFSMATTNTLTLSAWVNRQGANNTGNYIEGIAGKYKWAGGINGREYLIANDTISNTGWSFLMSSDGTSGGEKQLYSGVVPVNGTWYFVTGVMDGSAMQVYVNGVLKASSMKSAVFNSPNADFRIGICDSQSISNYQTFNGKIDEVVLSRTARNADWIKLAYETQRNDSMRTVIPDHLALPVIASNTPANLTVFQGDPATLSVSVSGPGPFQFRWYRGQVAPADTFPGQHDSTLLFSTVLLTDDTLYYCVVSNPYGSDTSRSARLTVKPNEQISNPIELDGTFVDSTHVRMSVYRYNELPLQSSATPSFPWYADSVWIWYKANGFPQRPQPGEPDLIKLPLSVLRQSTEDRFDILLPVRKYPSTSCYYYYFCASVYWKNTIGGPDSLAPFVDQPNTGDSVYMCDTSDLANPLKLSLAYTQRSDSVVLTLSNCTQLEWDLISSVTVQYAIGNVDVVSDSLPADLFDHSVDVVTKSYHDSRFASEEKWVYWEVFPVGKFGNKSPSVYDSCKVGVPRPQNTVGLSADQIASTGLSLFWTRPASPVDSIRLWYGFSEVPLKYQMSPGDCSPLVTLAGSDTAYPVYGLAANTTYYFGLQIKQFGLWSYVTDSSRLSVTTLEILDTVPMPNKLRLQSLDFDPSSNQVVMQWFVDTTGLSLEAGIVWSKDSGGFPEPKPPDTGKVTTIVDPATPMKYSIAISETDLQFNSDYFFAVWLRKVNGFWMQPTAASIRKLHIPASIWEQVVFFRSGTETVTAFSGNLVLKNIGGSYWETPVESKVQLLTLPVETNGFIPMSIAVKFEHQNAPPQQLNVGLAYFPFPTGFGISDLRMYRFKDGEKWMVNNTLDFSIDTIDSVYFVTIPASDCNKDPFIVMIDTVTPSITILNDGNDPIPANTTVVLSIETRDNVANSLLFLRGGRGEDGFPTSKDVYTTRARDTTYWTVPSNLVSSESGLRIAVVASDGHRMKIVNGSRDVIRPVSDSIMTPWLQWTPIGTNTILDNPGIGYILRDYADNNGMIKYDNTALRLFRWSKGDWAEYSDNDRTFFNLGPTSVIWLKRRLTTPIYFGKGKTASLRTPYHRSVPSKEWIDFCIPYRFNIRVGDILSATDSKQKNPDSSALLFYEWRRGSGDSLKWYYAEGVFLPLTIGKNDPKYELTSRNNTVYTVFNNSASPIDLVIPGVSVPLSGITGVAGKQKARNGWNLAVRSFSDEGTMSPVYCGYQESGKGSVVYPLPPSWNNIHVGIYDRERGQVIGNTIIHELTNGGHTYELIFENGTGKKSHVEYSIERLFMPDNEDVNLAVLDPETGSSEPSIDTLSLELKPYGRTYRWLAVGSDDYIKGMKNGAFRGEFKFIRVFPNPFRQNLRIFYQIPYGGIERIRCEVFDPRGRLLWKMQTGSRLHPGKHEIIWNPKKEKAIAAGTLIIRLSGFDVKNKKLGERFTRVTFLP